MPDPDLPHRNFSRPESQLVMPSRLSRIDRLIPDAGSLDDEAFHERCEELRAAGVPLDWTPREASMFADRHMSSA